MKRRLLSIVTVFTLICAVLSASYITGGAVEGGVIADWAALKLTVAPEPVAVTVIEESDTRDTGGFLRNVYELTVRSGSSVVITARPSAGEQIDMSVSFLPEGSEDRAENYITALDYTGGVYRHGSADTTFALNRQGKLVASYAGGQFQYQFNVVLFDGDGNEPFVPLPADIGTPSDLEAPVTPGPAAPAYPNPTTILVNGETTEFFAYLINDFNYLQLRDIAYIINGTEKQFEIVWDNDLRAIFLNTGQSYTPGGEEMTDRGPDIKFPSATTSPIYLNGQQIQLTAYLIDGYNYFMLRDIGQALDFNVSWENNMVVIDTSEGYSFD